MSHQQKEHIILYFYHHLASINFQMDHKYSERSISENNVQVAEYTTLKGGTMGFGGNQFNVALVGSGQC